MSLDQIHFSEQVQTEWSDPQMFEKLKQGTYIPKPERRVTS